MSRTWKSKLFWAAAVASFVAGVALQVRASVSDPEWLDVGTTVPVTIGTPEPTPAVTNPPTIDANTASAAELMTIPGVGPVIAGRIIAARPFRTVDDIDLVSGVGAVLMAAIRPRVFIGDAEPRWKKFIIRYPNGVEQTVELMEAE